MNKVKIDIQKLKYSEDMPKSILSFFDNFSQLDELAKKSILPHYQFVNPLTKEVRYLYDSKLVREYLNKNCLSEIKGANLTVLSFGKQDLPIDSISTPNELKGFTNSIFEISLSNIISVSGIYFLYEDEKLVYIGQSIHIHKRVLDHYSEGKKFFNRVFFIRVEQNSLLKIESELIKEFRPKYNLR